MIRVNLDQIPSQPDTSPIFVGNVTRKGVVGDDNPGLLRVNLVEFHDGARNKLHHHGADQLLVVTSGRGVVANETETIELEPGDVVLIPAGEKHWHGAQPGQDFAHLAVLTPGSMTIDEED